MSEETERRVGMAVLEADLANIKKTCERIEKKLDLQDTHLGKVEGRVKWMQGIGVMFGTALGAFGRNKNWW